MLADAVIAGEGREYVVALAWLDAAEARRLLGRAPTVEGDLVRDPDLAAHLAAALTRGAGTAGRVERLVVLSRPADLDAGEITDQGVVDQRRVLRNRAGLVDLVYADPVGPGVVTLQEGTS